MIDFERFRWKKMSPHFLKKKVDFDLANRIQSYKLCLRTPPLKIRKETKEDNKKQRVYLTYIIFLIGSYKIIRVVFIFSLSFFFVSFGFL